MGILGYEAAARLARVPVDDHEKWMAGGGIRQWAKRRKQESVGEGGIRRARRKGHREVVGKEGRRGCVPKMWGGRANPGPHSVPVWEG